ncbi:methyl-accepting chemotaxis protein [Leeia sp. TBRC 13508]|uniref:Methyl-accepting chemotaxis protein n=1 Tax=Leeia speluncae TaxID=2884804 RepID=A0ABS8D5S6_9NEIS|nr:methyl-accepting chemotaxis protein [Leeia speluncae]MCB6183554.1 methyl-accepting chemotaxis protein [Leeia speluncae]
MNYLFKPAVALFNRLGYSKKFTLFGLLMLVPIVIITLMLASAMKEDAAFAVKERDGLKLVNKSIPLLTALADRRAFDTGVAMGDKAKYPAKLAAQDAKIKKLFADLESEENQLSNSLGTQEDFQKLKKSLSALPKPDGSDGAVNRANNEKTMQAVNLYLAAVGEKSNLILDPNVNSYYIADTLVNRVPGLINAVSETADLGVGVLVRSFPDVSEKDPMQISYYQLEPQFDLIQGNLSRLSFLYPEFKAVVTPNLTKLSGKVTELKESYGKNIVSTLAYTMSAAEFETQYGSVLQSVVDLNAQLVPQLDQLLTSRATAANFKLAFAIGIAAVMMLIVIYLFVGAYLSVIQAINSLEQASGSLASGKLATRVNLAAKDETARVAGSFNHMAEQVSGLIRQASESANAVVGSTTALVTSSTTVVEGTQKQTEAVLSASSAVEQMSVSIGAVAESVKETVQIAGSARDLSAQGQRSVQNVASEIHAVASSVRQAVSTVESLAQQSADIGLIVNVIKEVADQTNLLALNAAIEAARAGEQGRGFAVVADEVRKLAERTAGATAEINQKILSVQSQVKATVETMMVGNQRVGQCESLAQEASDALHAIMEQTQAAQERIQQIAIAAEQQNAASHSIATNIQSIADMADRNRWVVDQTVEQIKGMEQRATALNQAVSRFEL